MAKVRWAASCLAHNRAGEPCAAYAMTGGRLCSAHCGMALQVRAAAERRWLLEHQMAQFEHKLAKQLGRLRLRVGLPEAPAQPRPRHLAQAPGRVA